MQKPPTISPAASVDTQCIAVIPSAQDHLFSFAGRAGIAGAFALISFITS
jgi:hypothetical protein